jgi:glycosyltransferase involved in cell wall biosynthesis
MHTSPTIAIPTRATTANVAVVIPALNEAASMPHVLERLRALGLGRIRVVDNGSSDRTAEVARRFGAEVIEEPRRGYGQACWTGCQNLPAEVEWILFCNADGSDDLDHVPNLMQATGDSTELVLGTRTAGENGQDYLTPSQRFGNRLAVTLIRLLWGAKYGDLGPLRLISRRAFEQLKMQDRGFGWTVEMQVRAAEENIRVREVAVRNYPRRAGVSKISGTIKGSVQAGTIILSTIAKLWLQRAIVQRALTWISALLLLAGAMVMLPFGDFSVIGNVPKFLIGAGVMCLGYAVSWAMQRPTLQLLWTVSIGVRLILLFQHPGNDIWRYLWEGRVTLAGFNPYHLAPNAPTLEALRDTRVWPDVVQPTLTTIYPPLAQLCFKLLTSLGSSVFLFKTCFLLADLAVAGLLLKRFGRMAALAYAWNPLVIYSFAGGGHYDSLFILPLVGALSVISNGSPSSRKFLLGALLLGCSIAVKWASGPLALCWVWRTLRERGLFVALGTGLLTVLPLVALLLIFFPGTTWPQLGPHDWIALSWSLPLVPGLVKGLTGFAPHNQFYLLPVLAVAVIIALWQKDGWRAAAWFFFAVLVLSPANHAWYFTWFIAVAVALPVLSWSARLAGVSVFIYFWVVHVNATQGVWSLNPWLTAALWMPFVLPPLMTINLRRS